MDLVVDANVLFSTLIKESISYKLLFYESYRLYAPEFILVEIEKYKEELLQKTKRTTEEFYNLLQILRRRIILFPLDELIQFIKKAEQISPDPKDISYVALALKLNIPIWSNDKQLKEKQKIIKVYSTKDLLEMV